jgi:hypothetical protein
VSQNNIISIRFVLCTEDSCTKTIILQNAILPKPYLIYRNHNIKKDQLNTKMIMAYNISTGYLEGAAVESEARQMLEGLIKHCFI